MSRSAAYIPTKTAAFSAWFNNFQTLITANPAKYGLTTSDATSIAAQYTSWLAAYTPCLSTTTKTHAAVVAKDASKVASLALVRPYAVFISKSAGVATTDKAALGVNDGTNTPTPIPTPTSTPILSQISNNGGIWTCKYVDSVLGGTSKAKAPGATGVQIFSISDVAAHTNTVGMFYNTTVTKTPFQLDFSAGTKTNFVTLAARYVTATGKVGPWSPVLAAING